MKKAKVMFLVSVLILAGLASGMLKGHLAGYAQELVMAGIVLILVGLAAYL